MPGTQTVTFAALAAVVVISAYRVVTTGLITHAALFLALSFVGVAGLFLLFQADFLAAAQVLIYAGAITTMIIFAVMLSDVREVRVAEERPASPLRRLWRGLASPRFGLLPVVVALLFVAAMYLVYGQAMPEWGRLISRQPPETYSVRAIGRALFTPDGFVIPFEVASFVLLVAMVGAIVLTAKEDR